MTDQCPSSWEVDTTDASAPVEGEKVMQATVEVDVRVQPTRPGPVDGPPGVAPELARCMAKLLACHIQLRLTSHNPIRAATKG